jgi:hypothetical protein
VCPTGLDQFGRAIAPCNVIVTLKSGVIAFYVTPFYYDVATNSIK